MSIRLLTILLFFTAGACSSASDDTTGTGQKIRVGAEVLLSDHLNRLEGKRVGLVMNPTARVGDVHMLDTLLAREVNVTALFAPEHGFRGEAGDGEIIEDGRDRATGLPVYSLYGEHKKPSSEMLEQVDLLLFDMQDVGARFYTFNVTLGLVLEAAARHEVPVWILDRPNPAGGDYVAGWRLRDKYKSFIGAYPVPMIHGLTLGELANMMIGEKWIEFGGKPQVRIIPMEGWKRSMKWPDTGLDWHPPSPNLPSFEHAYLYLGTVLFEGTSISEGRGTENPFLTIGAPSVDISDRQLRSLREKFPTVSIEQITFTPRSIPGKSLHPKHEGKLCRGVTLGIRNYNDLDPVAFGVNLLHLILKSADSAEVNEYINKLAGIDLKSELKEGSQPVIPSRTGGLAEFLEARKPYLIY